MFVGLIRKVHALSSGVAMVRCATNSDQHRRSPDQAPFQMDPLKGLVVAVDLAFYHFSPIKYVPMGLHAGIQSYEYRTGVVCVYSQIVHVALARQWFWSFAQL